jgi:hypothetical protein
MKRRNFFQTASYGIAGLSLVTSCTSKDGGDVSHPRGQGDIAAGEEPAYRRQIKPSFTGGKLKNANDTIVAALIGAGSWGSVLIMNAMETGEKIRVKYVCDVDDTRGGNLAAARCAVRKGYSFRNCK